jgi:ribonuclease Y
MLPIVAVAVGLVALLAGVAVGFYFRRGPQGESRQLAEENANRILAEAEQRQKEVLLEAKEEALRLRQRVEDELKEGRRDLQQQERRLAQKEENLDRKVEAQERRERSFTDRESSLDALRAEIEQAKNAQLRELERVAALTTGEARDILLTRVDQEIRDEANRRLREADAEMQATAEMRARKILATAIQRFTSEVTQETTVSVVPIPSDDMKGRIIGREGRNIRALESATGVDLIIDDTPDAVTLSAFDPVRREIARVALTQLIQDGRIHPTRIEEVVEKAKAQVDQSLREAGENAAIEAGVTGLHPEILRTFGRLRYRTSYGQNQLKHAVESSHLAALIAKEVGADVNICRRGGLLHDLGKAIDHDVEGTHAMLGAEILRRHNVNPAVVHCVEAHHEEVEPSTVEAIIVMMADAISGGRPGARRESLDNYVKRLQELESVANSFNGVEKSFAIQAGREVRIIVKPEQIDDLEAMRLARDISRKIEESLEYPGQIKVTVVRETRAVDYAK